MIKIPTNLKKGVKMPTKRKPRRKRKIDPYERFTEEMIKKAINTIMNKGDFIVKAEFRKGKIIFIEMTSGE